MTVGYWYKEIGSGKIFKLIDTCSKLYSGEYGVLIVEKDSSVGKFYYEYCNVKYLDRALFLTNFIELGSDSDLEKLLEDERLLKG